MDPFVASWSECHLPLPNVKLTNPSREERRAWLYALLSAAQQAFSLLFPRAPESLRDARALAEEHEKGKAIEPLARLYYYSSRVEWPQLPLAGEPFKGRGLGVVSTAPPFVRKTSCSSPPQYVAAFAASIATWAVKELRELEGLTPSLSPTEAIERGQPLLSKRPLWIEPKALEKAYPEVKVRKGRGRRPKA